VFANDRVRLRPAVASDAEPLYAIMADPVTHLIADDRPFLPQSLPSYLAVLEKQIADQAEAKDVSFVAETVADGMFVGYASVWGFNDFNRYAHLGITIAEAVRGQGYGRDVVSLLCRYGFRMRNLRRLEMETLASNTAMRRTAEACGFVQEGVQRGRDYDGNGYADLVLYGLLRSEWSPTAASAD
jgi:RimJ/RimL family protein N-acetyltransferase